MKSEQGEQKFKICFIGMTGSGKTSIINRLVNNCFTDIYDPTYQKTEYLLEFEPFEENLSQNITSNMVTYANHSVSFVLEDMFGLDNTILQTPEQLIKSIDILELRKQMIKDFQEIMLTNKHLEKIKFEIKSRKSMSNSLRNKQENLKESETSKVDDDPHRIGFVFVIDINSKIKSIKEIIKIIENIKSVEKSSNCKPADKMVILNKTDLVLDKADKKKLSELQELEKTLTKEYDCDVFKISTKTLDNFKESINFFLNKICINRLEKMKEVIKTDYFIEEEDRNGCFNVNCTRGFTCG